MNSNILKRTLTQAMFCVCMSSAVFAQEPKKAPASPPMVATGQINGAAVTINYSSPAVKGRKIWGELVPYQKVWRAGANQATTFETDKPLKIQGKTLNPGKYSLYATPGETEWKIIFNSEVGQWGIKRTGESTEDPAKDVVVASVKPKKSSTFNERLTYTITPTGFDLKWENLSVPVIFK
jgi:hypothetical protein